MNKIEKEAEELINAELPLNQRKSHFAIDALTNTFVGADCMKETIYIFSDGELVRKDNSLMFETKDGEKNTFQSKTFGKYLFLAK